MIRITTHLGEVEIDGAGENELNEMFGVDEIKVKEISWIDGQDIEVSLEDGSSVNWDSDHKDQYSDAALLVLELLGF